MSMDKYLEALNNAPDFTKKIEEKHLTPAELKKREEVAKSMEKENPGMPMGKKMAIATSVAKRVAEAVVGTKPKTEKEKKLAAMSGDKNTITHGDVLKARGVTKEEAEHIEEEALGDHAKLRNYADKRGGMDKKDFHTAANHIESGNVSALKRHLNKMDTDPRDKVLDHVKKAHWGKLGYSSMNEESEQIDEARAMGYKMSRSSVAGDRGDSKGGEINVPQQDREKIAQILSTKNKEEKKTFSAKAKEAGKRVAGTILSKMRAKASK